MQTITLSIDLFSWFSNIYEKIFTLQYSFSQCYSNHHSIDRSFFLMLHQMRTTIYFAVFMTSMLLKPSIYRSICSTDSQTYTHGYFMRIIHLSFLCSILWKHLPHRKQIYNIFDKLNTSVQFSIISSYTVDFLALFLVDPHSRTNLLFTSFIRLLIFKSGVSSKNRHCNACQMWICWLWWSFI